MIGNVSIDRALYDLGSSVSLIPYYIFNRLGLGEWSPISISLQLADHSIKYPLGILEDVPIKAGDFYMPIDFVILVMAEDSHTQIILGRPFLATAGCKIDVKEGKLTFDVGECHTEFGLFKDFDLSHCTLPYCGCEVLDSDVSVKILDMTLNDLFSVDCAFFECSGLDDVTMDSLPPSIIEDKPYAVDESYVSDCCRFITLLMSVPPMSGDVPEIDVAFRLEFRPFDGNVPRMTVLLDPSLWSTLMLKKDLNPEILR